MRMQKHCCDFLNIVSSLKDLDLFFCPLCSLITQRREKQTYKFHIFPMGWGPSEYRAGGVNDSSFQTLWPTHRCQAGQFPTELSALTLFNLWEKKTSRNGPEDYYLSSLVQHKSEFGGHHLKVKQKTWSTSEHVLSTASPCIARASAKDPIHLFLKS